MLTSGGVVPDALFDQKTTRAAIAPGVVVICGRGQVAGGLVVCSASMRASSLCGG
jgi:hypothetical protein